MLKEDNQSAAAIHNEASPTISLIILATACLLMTRGVIAATSVDVGCGMEMHIIA